MKKTWRTDWQKETILLIIEIMTHGDMLCFIQREIKKAVEETARMELITNKIFKDRGIE